ncbi:MAG: hypothetical protein RIQ81_1255 [Pseudomonadota bacterium]|jgi:4,5-DOPA dioxygenase extradiol
MNPVTIFVGHGSPMNALPTHEPGRQWQSSLRHLGDQILPGKRAILAISAHWQTRGTEIFASAEPHMIHDFIGFPKELHAFNYPVPGATTEGHELADKLNGMGHDVRFHDQWGYDHGVWSVLAHLAPQGNIPVFMLSLDRKKTLEEHLKLACDIGTCLPQDVLTVASGNIVHSLAMMADDPGTPPPQWAMDFDERVARALVNHDWDAITGISREAGTPDKLSVPTLDHFIPLVYAMGIAGQKAAVSFPYQGFDHATVSMRCALFLGRR